MSKNNQLTSFHLVNVSHWPLLLSLSTLLLTFGGVLYQNCYTSGFFLICVGLELNFVVLLFLFEVSFNLFNGWLKSAFSRFSVWVGNLTFRQVFKFFLYLIYFACIILFIYLFICSLYFLLCLGESAAPVHTITHCMGNPNGCIKRLTFASTAIRKAYSKYGHDTLENKLVYTDADCDSFQVLTRHPKKGFLYHLISARTLSDGRGECLEPQFLGAKIYIKPNKDHFIFEDVDPQKLPGLTDKVATILSDIRYTDKPINLVTDIIDLSGC